MKQKIIIKLIFFFLLVFSIFLEFSSKQIDSDSIIIMLSSGVFSIVIKLIIKPFLMEKILEKIDKKEDNEMNKDKLDKMATHFFENNIKNLPLKNDNSSSNSENSSSDFKNSSSSFWNSSSNSENSSSNSENSSSNFEEVESTD